MKNLKLNIDALDIASLYGKSTRFGYRQLRLLRKALKKKKNDLITTYDLSLFFHVRKEDLDKFFYGE